MPRFPMPDMLAMWNDSDDGRRSDLWYWDPRTKFISMGYDMPPGMREFPKWFIARVQRSGVKILDFHYCRILGTTQSVARLFDIPETVINLTIYRLFQLTVLPKLPAGLLFLTVESTGITHLPATPKRMLHLHIGDCRRLQYLPTIPHLLRMSRPVALPHMLQRLDWTFTNDINVDIWVGDGDVTAGDVTIYQYIFDGTVAVDMTRLRRHRAAVRLQRWWRILRWVRGRERRRRQSR